MALGLDLSTLIGGGGLAPVAGAVTALPGFSQNRERLAAAVAMGYQGLDFYDAYRPALFAISLLGLLTSGVALYKRPKQAEAVTLYTVTAIASAGMAFFTRPDFMRAAPTPPANANPQPSTGAMTGLLSYLDAKGAAYTASDPGWEGRTLLRLANDMGSGTIDPSLQTMLTANSH